MGQKKISQLPQDTGPTTNDSVPTYDPDTSATKRVLISDLITLFFNNIPSGSPSLITRFDESFGDFIASGGVWTADSAGVNRNASMTAIICYINGRRITISAVSARTFTASKDTYIDILDNGDGTGTLVYTEVANNAASPALAASSIRLGIVVTAAGSIAASTSIGQGGFANIAPVISTQVFKGFDSLGNLIYPKGPATPRQMQNPVKFRLNMVTATNTSAGAHLLIPFDRKLFDTGNNTDVTTNKGRFTAPIAGFYFFSASCPVAANPGSFFLITLYKNGVGFQRGDQINGDAAGASAVNFADLVQLAAGDYVEMFVFASNAVAIANLAPEIAQFSGFLVSAS